MIKSILSIIVGLIFVVLSILHFYWAFGGKKYFHAAIPDRWHKSKMIEAPLFKSMTIVVAFGLLVFSYIILSNSSYISQLNIARMNATNWGTLAIAIIFILRAIGDFDIAGFFKKTKNGAFAEMDSKYFSPLCLFIGLASLVIYLS